MGQSEHTPWVTIAGMARSQWSQVTTAQLRSSGLSFKAIRAAVDRGHLLAAFTGVYSVGHAIAHPRERAMAAVLACGPRALLSHLWALWNFGLVGLPGHPPDVTAPPSRHDREGLTLHRSRSQRPDANHGIPTTTPNRSIIDAAPQLSAKQLRRVVNQAQILRLTTAESLREEAKRTRGVPTKALLAQLPVDQHGATRSLLEDLLLDLHRDRDLPQPLINAAVEGIECDFHYAELRLVIEADGFSVHGTRIAFEDDHEKRLFLEARDQKVVAVTYRQVTVDRERTAGQLEAVIAARAEAVRLRP